MIHCLAAGDTQVEGSLGGFQLLDLTPEGIRHQKIFSVGFDLDMPTLSQLDLSQSTPVSASDVYKTTQESLSFDPPMEKAFNFTFHQPASLSTASAGSMTPSQSEELTSLTVRMASLCYTHAPGFLQDINLCLSEFTDYMSSVGSQLRDVATEVALVWVHRKSETSAVLYGSNLSLDNLGGSARKVRYPSLAELNEDTLDDLQQDLTIEDLEEENKPFELKLDVVLATPVIMLPRTPNSPEVLVAHLGRISIQNGTAHNANSAGSESFMQQQTSSRSQPGQQAQHNPDKIYLEIRDMSMYSMNLDKQKSLHMEASVKGSSMKASMFSTPQPGGFIRTSYGMPILHDTIMEVTIEKQEPDETFINVSDDLHFNDHLLGGGTPGSGGERPGGKGLESRLQVNGKVISPLKVALSKSVYEQILQTLDNIAPDDNASVSASSQQDGSASVLSDINEEGESLSLSHSVSALKMDGSSVTSSASKDRLASTSTTSENLSMQAGQKDPPITIQADFEMHTFNIQMTGDLGEGEQGLVNLSLQDFKVYYTKADPWAKTLEVSLQSLIMEDLLQEKNSAHRHLMVSYAPAMTKKPFSPEFESRPYLSTSCPTSMIEIPEPRMPPSLPSSFHRENVFDMRRARSSVSTTRSATSDHQ